MSDHHEIFTQFFLDPEVIFSSYIMFINAPTKVFTLRHLVTLAFHVHASEFSFTSSIG